MLALLYDIHGNLPALEAVLGDARARGADRWLLGGDMAPFGAWPAETVALLQRLDDATWIRGHTERWLVDRHDLPDDDPMATAAMRCREALGDDLADELGAVPERALLGDDTVAWHASPVSDMRSFAPEADGGDAELLAGVSGGRVVFGHTHRQFRRDARTPGGAPVELVNPGSVGIPLDGDHRAAYALLHPGGDVELRRVAYDHAAAAQALRGRYGDEPWVEIVSGRIERARLSAD
jgi:diadenosine tetraphosphatase ApaH/serine/threonine PP2A family protein phosphatase